MDSLPLPPEPVPLPPAPVSAHRQVLAAYERIAEADRPELWITLRPCEDVLVDAKAVDERVRAGERLPLAGMLVAVKDNVDVAGLPTTAGCPGYAYTPEVSAPAVARLVRAGAVVVGKTNLDQFATGLVGTRSPYGVVAGANDRDRIAGGSSSGSAVAVALELVDVAIGTDTAGSGRIPAAFNGIVGIKPTLGLVPTTGVVPANRSYDCVTVLARTVADGQRALAAMTGADESDPRSRTWPESVRLAAGERPTIAVPDHAGLAPLPEEARRVFTRRIEDLLAAGVGIETIDITPFLEAGKLFHDGALAAERYAAVGEFVERFAAEMDPSVAEFILAGREFSAHRLAGDQARLAEWRVRATEALAGKDALLLPTAPEHPTLAAVEADPVGANRRLGTYTSFVNLLDMTAVAVPAGRVAGGAFGVSVITRAFDDQIALDIAALLAGEQLTDPYPEPGVDIVVFGAHLRGQPLNHQLAEHGARFRGAVLTAERYRMVALPVTPPEAGIVRTCPGAALSGERWTISPAGLGRFLAALGEPMGLGEIELEDGSTAIGFRCDTTLAAAGKDITEFGCWRAYLRHLTATRPMTP
ncbi:MAG TPA: allophanate hydrolase [Amycolatopsis sp.]|uniref:allophanate hydrolase n=1 Tax=Amycolatopsis sp. TaxID=37632 RepID=UPI002B45FFEA|nr:allophanate hydrolase [Amycolatopsis sp.]HKS49558.1 allophanate hydrolase [Amycolatopsis sp.]